MGKGLEKFLRQWNIKALAYLKNDRADSLPIEADKILDDGQYKFLMFRLVNDL